jgi:hypothetical protein
MAPGCQPARRCHSVTASDLFMCLASRRPLGRSCCSDLRQEHFHEENPSSPEHWITVDERGRDGRQRWERRPESPSSPRPCSNRKRSQRHAECERPINRCVSRCERPDELNAARCNQPSSLKTGRRGKQRRRRQRQRHKSLKARASTSERVVRAGGAASLEGNRATFGAFLACRANPGAAGRRANTRMPAGFSMVSDRAAKNSSG